MLRLFDNSVLRIFEPKRDGVKGSAEDCTTKIFMICAANQRTRGGVFG
jgi:hypothetical protein